MVQKISPKKSGFFSLFIFIATRIKMVLKPESQVISQTICVVTAVDLFGVNNGLHQ